MFILILSLAFALFVAIFALQNSAPVPIYIFWTIKEVPLVLVILGSVISGALIVFLLALWREFRYRRTKKTLETKVGNHDLSLGKGEEKAEEKTENKSISGENVSLEDNKG